MLNSQLNFGLGRLITPYPIAVCSVLSIVTNLFAQCMEWSLFCTAINTLSLSSNPVQFPGKSLATSCDLELKKITVPLACYIKPFYELREIGTNPSKN